MKSPNNASVVASALKWVRRLSWLGCAVVLPLSIWAAEGGTGRVVGTVSNAETGDYLEGAVVEVPALGMSTTTNRRGEFSLGNVAAGDYKVTVSYAGLDPKTLSASVAAGGTAVLEAKLTAEVYQLETYTVTGVKEGNAAALTVQKNAANVVNVVSMDAFGDVADGNIGNFLQRLPGIDVTKSNGDINGFGIRGIPQALNTVSMDGEMLPAAFAGDGGAGDRAFPIDNMPAELISSLKVTKSPTPDMPADSLGGNVDLKSKSAMDFTARRITYRLSLNNNLDRSGTEWTPSASFTYMDRFGDRGEWGVTVSGSYAKTANTRDRIQNNYGYYPNEDDPNAFLYNTRLRLLDDDFTRERMATSLKLEHKIGKNIMAYLGAVYTQVDYNMDRYDYRIASRNGSIQSGAEALYFTSNSIEAMTVAMDSDRKNKAYKVNAGMDITLPRGEMAVRLNHAEGKSHYVSHTMCGVSTRNAAITATVDSTGWGGRERPVVIQPAFPAGGNTTIFYGTNLDAYSAQYFDSDTTVDDELNEGRLDWRWDKPLQEARWVKFVKVGGLFRLKDYNEYKVSNRYTYNTTMGGSVAQFAKPKPGYALFDGYYPAFTQLDIKKAAAMYDSNPGAFTANANNKDRNIPSIVNEKVGSVYLMSELEYKRASIVFGVRVESTRQTGSGDVIEAAEELEELLPGTKFNDLDEQYTDIFPGIHFRYFATKDAVLRASWSQSMGRPSISKQAPGYSLTDGQSDDDPDKLDGYVTINNTNLKPMYSNNFDISAEYYFKKVGILSLGAFAKRMDGFIYTERTTVPNDIDEYGRYANYGLRTQRNMADVAKVQGLEFNYRQALDFLPGILRDTTFFFNCTWQKTSGKFGDKNTQTTDLVGFKPFISNVGFVYKYRKFETQVTFNYSKAYFASVNNSSVVSTRINETYWMDDDMTLDLEFKYRWQKMDFFLTVNNVLNYSPNTYILENKSLVRSYETNGTRIAVGVSGRF